MAFARIISPEAHLSQPTPPHNNTADMHENWAWYILAVAVLVSLGIVVILL